jgi:uncharacterized protein involved in type VI secretion and phage assembly
MDRLLSPFRGSRPSNVGVQRAEVIDDQDPESGARVLVSLPRRSGDDHASAWAPLATLMAGSERGTWFVPEVGDEVLIAFENGDPRRPYIVGALWTSRDALPETGPNRNRRKTILTRSGARITIDDGDATAPPSITLDDADGNSVRIEAAGISIAAAGKVKVAATVVEINAAQVDADVAVATFTGAVKCTTLIADSVVATSYSPGTGNVL